MSLDDLNREQKRQLKRQGALNDQGQPTRAPAPRPAKKERVGVVQYLGLLRHQGLALAAALSPGCCWAAA